MHLLMHLVTCIAVAAERRTSKVPSSATWQWLLIIISDSCTRVLPTAVFPLPPEWRAASSILASLTISIQHALHKWPR